jgi:hypothetical protein
MERARSRDGGGNLLFQSIFLRLTVSTDNLIRKMSERSEEPRPGIPDARREEVGLIEGKESGSLLIR